METGWTGTEWNRRVAAQEAQVLALLHTVSSVVMYNVRTVIGRSDVEALSM